MRDSFITRIEPEKEEPYTAIFSTDDFGKYRLIEDECRKMIGHVFKGTKDEAHKTIGPAEPITNADKYFRNATDEELAEIIAGVDRAKIFEKFCDIVLAGENPGFCDDDCKECALKWLKQEVADD